MRQDTLLGALESACARGGDRVALSFGDVRTTYRRLWEDANALGRAYRLLGVEPGARVVCHLANQPEYLVGLAGAWVCGAVHVGVDREFTPIGRCGRPRRDVPSSHGALRDQRQSYRPVGARR